MIYINQKNSVLFKNSWITTEIEFSNIFSKSIIELKKKLQLIMMNIWRFEKDRRNKENIIKDARNLSGLTQEIDDSTVKYFKTGKKKWVN